MKRCGKGQGGLAMLQWGGSWPACTCVAGISPSSAQDTCALLSCPSCRAPAQGRYKLHVRGHQLGADGGVAHIRGSPFTVECSDPWEQRRLVGAAPARRPGATLTSLGTDLVVFGGDKSLAAVCHAPPAGDAAGEPWQWHPTAEGGRPPARKGHAAAAAPDGAHLLVCGGVALEGEAGAELADVATLASHGTSFAGTSWAWVAAGPAPQLHQRADGAEVPAERSGHCAVTLPGAASLLVFGGERQGQLTNELLLLDTSNKVCWVVVHEAVGGEGRVLHLQVVLSAARLHLPEACPSLTLLHTRLAAAGAPLGGARGGGRAAVCAARRRSGCLRRLLRGAVWRRGSRRGWRGRHPW